MWARESSNLWYSPSSISCVLWFTHLLMAVFCSTAINNRSNHPQTELFFSHHQQRRFVANQYNRVHVIFMYFLGLALSYFARFLFLCHLRNKRQPRVCEIGRTTMCRDVKWRRKDELRNDKNCPFSLCTEKNLFLELGKNDETVSCCDSSYMRDSSQQKKREKKRKNTRKNTTAKRERDL